MIELSKAAARTVPGDWETIMQTSKVVRFRSPFIVEHLDEMARLSEQLTAEANTAWSGYLSQFADRFDAFRDAVSELAVLDCLQSLARVSNQPGWVKPIILDIPTDHDLSDDDSSDGSYGTSIRIVGGRNPVVTALLDDSAFVPNDTDLSNATGAGASDGYGNFDITWTISGAFRAHFSARCPLPRAQCDMLALVPMRIGC